MFNSDATATLRTVPTHIREGLQRDVDQAEIIALRTANPTLSLKAQFVLKP